MRETIALVTGPNKGIGREIARQLSARGIRTLMAARDRERGEKTVAEFRGQGLPVELDVISHPSVNSAAAQVERGCDHLDILVNNAGIRLDWSAGSELTVDTLKETFETNVFGVFRVTKALLPLLRKSAHGRIVNMSSGLGSLTWNTDPNSSLPSRHRSLAYSSTKAALNMITVQLADELKGARIKVNWADPGFTATDMNEHREGKPSNKEQQRSCVWRCPPTTALREACSATMDPDRGRELHQWMTLSSGSLLRLARLPRLSKGRGG